ncbi:MAG: tRNA (N(6)-L-threonylcarbamoyladenosine(37)-C(2))-methylthiotransferase MtaB [Geminicoccaceae bacterium]|nr:tRNA (N(6)-L-threonylcarbamoyladenosine(37)-C(2))-methylthiotransferase MtaB [Geminicoccaceae bacterium]MCS7266926.1 tRNA (N(6)-L-threonylcarbamoyladenosine(37)-C(2))-methylthiotransferase MtaB [Geminicoccaceae bacterium]MCX7628809.1 tRNA (N(6)-L-threonylcarbamoyladenosine(37)-C(2))-methylthiotransferase MtaB [Geminicoccaceae bacterium]MDW8124150.1 tRNA (N(6)-L-threonylcarbamoyladenosine(37)-C(2))-methylthiotransferase MtaB [Geminicoccaceae bacterium]MDW8342558.1 tRNA (N(6)-L-threonylcarbamo
MSGLEVVTFGCRLNAFESELIRRHARAAGLEKAVIVHSCAVTAEAERQVRQAIRRARRENPEARIIVTGCSAQLAAERYRAMPEVDHVLGNAEKLDPAIWRALARLPAGERRIEVGDVTAVRETAAHLLDGFDGRSRAFLEVQQGCDHRCTFCIIPFARGPARSVPVPAVIEGARRLLEAGFPEIVLTGVDLTSWGRDLEGSPRLGRLVGALLDGLPELGRLRLSSLDPAEFDPELEERIASEPRLMPHLHLSVQSGDDLILKRMKRRHDRAAVIGLCERLRAKRPELVFGADLIAGFPTEDEDMFARTLALVEEAGLTFLHVFPYSPRPGTPAARMPQVPVPLRKERAARLRAAGARRLDGFLRSQIGRRVRGLVERGGRGHTDQYAPFRLSGEAPPPATVHELEVLGVEEGALRVRIAGRAAEEAEAA